MLYVLITQNEMTGRNERQNRIRRNKISFNNRSSAGISITFPLFSAPTARSRTFHFLPFFVSQTHCYVYMSFVRWRKEHSVDGANTHTHAHQLASTKQFCSVVLLSRAICSVMGKRKNSRKKIV